MPGSDGPLAPLLVSCRPQALALVEAGPSARALRSQPGWDENRKWSPVPGGCRLPFFPGVGVAAPEGPESPANGCWEPCVQPLGNTVGSLAGPPKPTQRSALQPGDPSVCSCLLTLPSYGAPLEPNSAEGTYPLFRLISPGSLLGRPRLQMWKPRPRDLLRVPQPITGSART